MKDFIAVFIICLIFSVIATIFFNSFILSNIWVILIAVALVLAIFVNIFFNQVTRIEELERKVEELIKESRK